VKNEAILPVAQFLARVWGEKPEVRVVLDYNVSVPCTDLTRIYMPPPSRYPVTTVITGYRLWRSSLWHESMHIRYPPPAYPPKYAQGYRVLKDVVNVIEDVRIEQLGFKEYPGMRRELDLKRAVYFYFVQPPQNNLEAYAQLMLFHAVKDAIVPECVIEAARYTYKALKEGVDSITIALKVCKMLGVDPDDRVLKLPGYFINLKTKKIPAKDVKRTVEGWLVCKNTTQKELTKKSEQKEQGKATEREQATKEGEKTSEGTEGGGADEKAAVGEDVDEDIASDVDDVDTLLEPPEEIRDELKLVEEENKRLNKIREGASDAAVGKITLPSKLDKDESVYYDQDLILHLKAQLRKLRKGWKEIQSHTGDFDIDSYVARQSKVFVDEERLKIGGFKVLILLDHSGSISKYHEKYKKACIALAEALSTLNIPFAMYAFSQSMYYKFDVDVYLIKSFDEKWTRMNAKRLAQIEADGGTPLAKVYEKLEPIVVKGKGVGKGKLYFITLTDGDPDPGTRSRCRDLIRKYKLHAKMIAIAFGDSTEKAVSLAENLKDLGYERYIALDDLRKLPEKVLGLLGE
jgi:hypothetical protein